MRDALLLMVSVTEGEKHVTNRKDLFSFADLFSIARGRFAVNPPKTSIFT